MPPKDKIFERYMLKYGRNGILPEEDEEDMGFAQRRASSCACAGPCAGPSTGRSVIKTAVLCLMCCTCDRT